MRKNGFILHITILFIFIVFGIFSLLSFVANSSINLALFEKKNKIQSLDLSNTYSAALYEFYLIDTYIYDSKIKSKEEYIWKTSSEERLWNFWNIPEKTSIGGFTLNSITPSPSSLVQDGTYLFKMEFLKKVTLSDEKSSPFLTLSLYTENVQLTCGFNKSKNYLDCDENGIKIINFRAVGEVFSYEGE